MSLHLLPINDFKTRRHVFCPLSQTAHLQSQGENRPGDEVAKQGQGVGQDFKSSAACKRHFNIPLVAQALNMGFP